MGHFFKSHPPLLYQVTDLRYETRFNSFSVQLYVLFFFFFFNKININTDFLTCSFLFPGFDRFLTIFFIDRIFF